MQKTKFTVAACTQNKDGKFVWKLVVIHQAEAFGIQKDIKRTYYIGGMPKSVPVGTEVEDTLSKFDIIERPVALITDEKHTGDIKTMDEAAAKASGFGYKVVNLKWLHLKAA